MKVRSDSKRGRRKDKRHTEADDPCGTVMDESLVISFVSDYELGEESDEESKGNVSLGDMTDFAKGECSRSSSEEEDDEKGEGEGRRTESGKRKRVDLMAGRRRRRKAAGDGVVTDVDFRAKKGEVAVR